MRAIRPPPARGEPANAIQGHAVRVWRNAVLLDEVPASDTNATTSPTMKLFQRVPADMVGRAKAEITSQTPAAVFT